MTKYLPCAVLLLLCATPAATQDAKQLLAQGRADEAIALLKSRTAAGPRDADAFHLLSRAYYHAEMWDAAIENGQRAVALQPNNSAYRLWLGRAYGRKAEHVIFFRAAGLARKVRQEFERAVQLDPASVAARSDLAEFYLEAPGIMGGGRDKARAQIAEIEKRDPAAAHWLKGRLAEKEGDAAAAEREFRAAVLASRDAAGRRLDLAAYFLRAKRPAQMEEAIQRALAAPQRPAHILADAAELLFESGRDPARAAQLLRQYLAAPDKSEDVPAFRAHHLLGQVLEMQGQREAAAAEYRAALQLAKDYTPARESLRKLGG